MPSAVKKDFRFLVLDVTLKLEGPPEAKKDVSVSKDL